MRNPNVTVRWRGVMEKCTYCIQRISAARINSENDNRQIRDREIQTACQQACPANAIIFGDLNDPNSQRLKIKIAPAEFCDAWEIEHASPHDLSGQAEKSQTQTLRMNGIFQNTNSIDPPACQEVPAAWISIADSWPSGQNYETVTETIGSIVLEAT